MSSDRAAVAREVLTEFTEYFSENFASTVTHRDLVAKFTAERYPSPPAPETVTVEEHTWELSRYGHWQHAHDGRLPSGVDAQYFANRIASDARVLAEREARIAELEQANAQYLVELNAFNTRVTELPQMNGELVRRNLTLVDERDAALRALEEFKALAKDALGTRRRLQAEVSITSALKAKDAQWIRLAELGEGLGTAKSGPNSETRRDEQVHSPAPASASEPRSAATQIPLGAVVDWDHVQEVRDFVMRGLSKARECCESCENHEKAWIRTLDTLLANRHPVATRETVEAVKVALFESSFLDSRGDVAESILRAAGFTVQEGET